MLRALIRARENLRKMSSRFQNESKNFQGNKLRRKGLSWRAIGAIFGMVGAFIVPLFGALISEAAERSATANPALQTFAFVLVVSTIPLLSFGVYCLDTLVELSLPTRNYNASRRQLPDNRKPERIVRSRQRETGFRPRQTTF